MGPPPHLDVYNRWVEEGLHAGMVYLATQRALDRRADPAQILPGARTILSSACVMRTQIACLTLQIIARMGGWLRMPAAQITTM